MLAEELRARVEQLEGELIVLKHAVRFLLAAHRRTLPAFPGQRVDPETVRQVRQEIQAQWDREWQELTSSDPRPW